MRKKIKFLYTFFHFSFKSYILIIEEQKKKINRKNKEKITDNRKKEFYAKD